MEAINQKIKRLNTFGVQFIVRLDKQKNGKAPVYARVTVNGEIVHFALKKWVDPKYWDQRKGGGKGNKDEAGRINSDLEDVRVALGNYYQKLRLKGAFITAEAVKDAYLGTNEEAPNTLSRLAAYHNEQGSAILKWSTLKHYIVTQRYLLKFLEAKHQKKDLSLYEINFKFVVEFETFLRGIKPKDHQRPIDNNGVMKHLIRLRKMTSLAIKLDWIAADPFRNYKFKYKKVEKDFLTGAELQKLENANLGVARLNMVRDMFVFSCYTGLAYVDLMNLNEEAHLIIGINERQWIKTVRQKSEEPVTVPLLPQAKVILERYRDNIRSMANNTVFPKISNQKVNAYLKEIAKDLGIRKTLTFHVARHTFATTVTLSNGVPIETVSKMLGHTKIATTQIYARVLEKKIGEDMDVLQLKMENKAKSKSMDSNLVLG
jgi:site-specific recombinase XerD